MRWLDTCEKSLTILELGTATDSPKTRPSKMATHEPQRAVAQTPSTPDSADTLPQNRSRLPTPVTPTPSHRKRKASSLEARHAKRLHTSMEGGHHPSLDHDQEFSDIGETHDGCDGSDIFEEQDHDVFEHDNDIFEDDDDIDEDGISKGRRVCEENGVSKEEDSIEDEFDIENEDVEADNIEMNDEDIFEQDDVFEEEDDSSGDGDNMFEGDDDVEKSNIEEEESNINEDSMFEEDDIEEEEEGNSCGEEDLFEGDDDIEEDANIEEEEETDIFEGAHDIEDMDDDINNGETNIFEEWRTTSPSTTIQGRRVIFPWSAVLHNSPPPGRPSLFRRSTSLIAKRVTGSSKPRLWPMSSDLTSWRSGSIASSTAKP